MCPRIRQHVRPLRHAYRTVRPKTRLMNLDRYLMNCRAGCFNAIGKSLIYELSYGLIPGGGTPAPPLVWLFGAARSAAPTG